ncbi:MAG: heavy-metal-associated domain-containing protein [Oscillospiraceae bacterium]|nr:heavy-metal-associated domain-containing protein [Oscillospiraceae bacterium]
MTKTLVIEGMRCMHCKANVEKALSAVPGVKSAVVDLEKKTATVTTGLLAKVADADLVKAVTDLGFQFKSIS